MKTFASILLLLTSVKAASGHTTKSDKQEAFSMGSGDEVSSVPVTVLNAKSEKGFKGPKSEKAAGGARSSKEPIRRSEKGSKGPKSEKAAGGARSSKEPIRRSLVDESDHRVLGKAEKSKGGEGAPSGKGAKASSDGSRRVLASGKRKSEKGKRASGSRRHFVVSADEIMSMDDVMSVGATVLTPKTSKMSEGSGSSPSGSGDQAKPRGAKAPGSASKGSSISGASARSAKTGKEAGGSPSADAASSEDHHPLKASSNVDFTQAHAQGGASSGAAAFASVEALFSVVALLATALAAFEL